MTCSTVFFAFNFFMKVPSSDFEYLIFYVVFCTCSKNFFFLKLRSSNDGFSVVADYFGRGVFNKLTLVTDPPGSKTVGSLEVNLQRDLLIHTKRNC